MTGDLLEYVTMVHALVTEAQLRVTEGGPLDQQLNWALAYADRIDPLRKIREDVAKARERQAGEAAPGATRVKNADRADDDNNEEPWPEDPEPVDEPEAYYGDTDVQDDGSDDAEGTTTALPAGESRGHPTVTPEAPRIPPALADELGQVLAGLWSRIGDALVHAVR